MNVDLIGEVLARFANRLPDPGSQEMTRWEEQPALVELAQQIIGALSPVEPAAAFRQRLEYELLTALRTPVLVEEESPLAHSLMTRKNILLGTAAVGSAASFFSILGLAILLVRRRLTARPTPQSHGGVAL